MAMAARQEDEDPSPTFRRWSLCFAAIVAIHILLAWLLLARHPIEEAAPPPAIMLELAPMPAEQPTPKPRVEPTPQPKAMMRPLRSPAPKVDVPLPPAPPLAPNQIADEVQPDRAPTAAPAQREQATPSAAPLDAAAAASWQGRLLGRLQQVKRYPPAAQLKRQQGVVSLRFTMDRTGKVLSASIEKGSGFDLLDQEALALVHRAEPLPPPPPEIAGDPMELVVPVQFFLK